MVQWVNRLQNSIFVNLPPLPLSCEISGALHLARPGRTAGWQADKMQVNFEIFKIAYRQVKLLGVALHFVTKISRNLNLAAIL